MNQTWRGRALDCPPVSVGGRNNHAVVGLNYTALLGYGPESGSCNNPLRQGLSADLADGFRPNNVLGGIPTIALDYSPYWDAQLFEWTQDAIDQGFRGQVREEFQILTFVQDGLITGPNGGKFQSAGFAINCPIVHRTAANRRSRMQWPFLPAATRSSWSPKVFAGRPAEASDQG